MTNEETKSLTKIDKLFYLFQYLREKSSADVAQYFCLKCILFQNFKAIFS